MLISELKNNIVSNNIQNFYIFTGEEEGIMDIYIRQIAKKLGLTIRWANSVEDVSKQLNLKSLVKVRYLYLVRQDKAVKTQENLWDFLKNKIVGNYVILIEPTLDKKLRFTKFFEDCTVKFEKLSTDMLTQYGKRKCPELPVANLQQVAEWCGNSYLRYMNELDKIVTLSKATGITPLASLVKLEEDGGIYKEREFDVFKYTNLILTRNAFGCYRDLEYVKSQNCEILIVSLLASTFRNLVLLKNDGGGKGVCERTGLTSWQIKCTSDVDEYFTLDESESNMLFMQETETKLKTGVLDPGVALNYILAEIL